LAGGTGSDVADISYWVETEFSSALAMKLRTGQMSPEMRAVSLSDFAFLRKYSLTMISIRQSHFLAAAKLADNAALGLRAADALHLAVALDFGATLFTLDRKLAEAASAVGARVSIP
jgi:uncharacterized protein